jgi:dephospho-CoA kinase
VIVIAVTGMPGSGKSTVARVIARRLGYPLLVMGDVVREEVARRGLELTVHNIEEVARRLRELRGPGAIAELIVEKARALNTQGVVVDGVRSLDEVKVLSSLGRVYIVAVHSPPNLRFQRMISRGREGDVRSPEEFRFRDEANLRLGIGDVIALADYMIVNNSTLEKLIEEAERVAGEIENEARGYSGDRDQAN